MMVPTMQAETDRDSLQLQSLLEYTRRTSSTMREKLRIHTYMLSTATARIRGRRLRLVYETLGTTLE